MMLMNNPLKLSPVSRGSKFQAIEIESGKLSDLGREVEERIARKIRFREAVLCPVAPLFDSLDKAITSYPAKADISLPPHADETLRSRVVRVESINEQRGWFVGPTIDDGETHGGGVG